ncbi:MAG: flagellar biosynthesis protein FlhA [Actinobacteria bacterium]|nr:flagellar biosynthesis protein FlhA [Actinomycetota bacterium]
MKKNLAPIPGILMKNTDVMITFMIVAVILMMIVPIPPGLMDGLLGVNIALSMTIFLISLYTLKPLDFSIFPSLLLIATLFRLSLNISTTRLILLGGYAGGVINAFGHFVIGENFIVGFVVFLILVIVNFVVIIQGANRVAEVAARFTLDALPGKQMSIDADLNAGIITDEEAKKERKEIARQADFYGAMDGASKFVKGDAIAGVIIVLINLLGGFGIGMLQQGLSFAEALQKYSLLTVGDGLVSQIPALLVSVSSGLVVTRAVSDSNLSRQISLQFLAQPKAMGIAAAIIGMFGFIQGMPKSPFLIIGALLGTVAFFQSRKLKREAEQKIRLEEEKERQSIEGSIDEVDQALYVDLIEVELGYGLVGIVGKEEHENLSIRIDLVKKQIASETGFLVPSIRIRDNIQLGENRYRIKIKGTGVAENELYVNKFMILDPGGGGFSVKGEDTTEPVFGLPARWIDTERKNEAEEKGYTVIDPVSLLVTHLTETIKEHACEILGIQDVQKLLDRLSKHNPVVVSEVIPKVITLSELHLILRNLLRERIPIKDLTTILETISIKAKVTRNIDLLTEFTRQGLARSITKMYENPPGVLSTIVVDPEIEQKIMDSIQGSDNGIKCVMDPEYIKELMEKIKEEAKRVSMQGLTPVIISLAPVRLQLRQISERIKPAVVVLSYDEIIQGIKIEPVGMIGFK